MPYAPIHIPDDVKTRLLVGQTREDHWLEFKEQLGDKNVENAGDIAQFANASGGVLVIGAQEANQILTGFEPVPEPSKLIQRIEDIVKGNLTPVPVVEPNAIEISPGFQIVAVNVPPSLALIARHEKHERFEFLIRGHESKRYMTRMEGGSIAEQGTRYKVADWRHTVQRIGRLGRVCSRDWTQQLARHWGG